MMHPPPFMRGNSGGGNFTGSGGVLEANKLFLNYGLLPQN